MYACTVYIHVQIALLCLYLKGFGVGQEVLVLNY